MRCVPFLLLIACPIEPPKPSGTNIPTDGSTHSEQEHNLHPGLPPADNVATGEGQPPTPGDGQQALDLPVVEHAKGDVDTPDGSHPIRGELASEEKAGDVLPLYQRLPSFIDIIEEDSIKIKLTVPNASGFDFEFVVLREDAGRVFPKVLHKEVAARSPVIIQAPANFPEPVWVFVSVDRTGESVW